MMKMKKPFVQKRQNRRPCAGFSTGKTCGNCKAVPYTFFYAQSLHKKHTGTLKAIPYAFCARLFHTNHKKTALRRLSQGGRAFIPNQMFSGSVMLPDAFCPSSVN
jgi:hypothetical protein